MVPELFTKTPGAMVSTTPGLIVHVSPGLIVWSEVIVMSLVKVIHDPTL